MTNGDPGHGVLRHLVNHATTVSIGDWSMGMAKETEVHRRGMANQYLAALYGRWLGREVEILVRMGVEGAMHEEKPLVNRGDERQGFQKPYAFLRKMASDPPQRPLRRRRKVGRLLQSH